MSISQEEAEAEAAPHREIRKAEAEGFVARQLAWETKRAAKTAVKKEVQASPHYLCLLWYKDFTGLSSVSFRSSSVVTA